jgi:hypothetical protein
MCGYSRALADALAGVAVPGAGLLHNIVGHGLVQHVALFADALTVEMSNSASRKGAATLFLTILTLVCEPVTTSPSLTAAMRRISTRTEE